MFKTKSMSAISMVIPYFASEDSRSYHLTTKLPGHTCPFVKFKWAITREQGSFRATDTVEYSICRKYVKWLNGSSRNCDSNVKITGIRHFIAALWWNSLAMNQSPSNWVQFVTFVTSNSRVNLNWGCHPNMFKNCSNKTHFSPQQNLRKLYIYKIQTKSLVYPVMAL